MRHRIICHWLLWWLTVAVRLHVVTMRIMRDLVAAAHIGRWHAAFLHWWLWLLGIWIPLILSHLFAWIWRDADSVGVTCWPVTRCLLLLCHSQLLVLAVCEHLIKLVKEHRIRLNSLMIVHGLCLDVWGRWGVGTIAATKMVLVTNWLLIWAGLVVSTHVTRRLLNVSVVWPRSVEACDTLRDARHGDLARRFNPFFVQFCRRHFCLHICVMITKWILLVHNFCIII